MADRKRTKSLKNSTANRKEARNEKQARHHCDPPTKEHDPNTWLRTAWRWSRQCENRAGKLAAVCARVSYRTHHKETKDNMTLHCSTTRENINQSRRTDHLYTLTTILSHSKGSDFYLKESGIRKQQSQNTREAAAQSKLITINFFKGKIQEKITLF